MGNHKSNDLYDFLCGVTQDIAREYERIQKRAAEDPGTAGDQGEENWATLLRGWLPPTYQIVTKGRILYHDGSASPQVDVLVLRPSYPYRLLDKKLYLAGGVAAAFECKVTLKAEHIVKTMANSADIRRPLIPRTGPPLKELHSPIVYGLLAHSHVWKNEQSTPLQNIDKLLLAADFEHVKHPRETLDLLCVADLGCWINEKTPYSPKVNMELLAKLYKDEPDELRIAVMYSGVAITSYICYSYSREGFEQVSGFTPIGAMLCHMLTALAREDESIKSLAEYFKQASLIGSGQGYMRPWQLDVYSEQTKLGIERGGA